MRLIHKAREPWTLADVRRASTTDLSTPDGARDAFDLLDKNAVRRQLAEEQGSLCAFCMRRIDHAAKDDRGEPTMKIAHRTPIKVRSETALTWGNLLGSCDGGQRSAGRFWTCDAAQGSQALTVDPTSRVSVARLGYERRSGEGLFITSDDAAIRTDVEKTLNLNDGDLPALREQAWKAFQYAQRRRHPHAYGKPAWRTFFPTWLAEKGSRYPEMLGVIEHKLR